MTTQPQIVWIIVSSVLGCLASVLSGLVLWNLKTISNRQDRHDERMDRLEDEQKQLAVSCRQDYVDKVDFVRQVNKQEKTLEELVRMISTMQGSMKFIEQMPPVYRNPSSIAPAGKCDYAVPVGPGSIFAGQEGTPIAKIRDGTSNTLLVLEVNPDAAVIWTRPDDFEFDTVDPLVGLGKAHPAGFNAAMADGSVRFISIEIDPEVFLNLLNMADGQAVRPF